MPLVKGVSAVTAPLLSECHSQRNAHRNSRNSLSKGAYYYEVAIQEELRMR